jgi:hypothetical protein
MEKQYFRAFASGIKVTVNLSLQLLRINLTVTIFPGGNVSGIASPVNRANPNFVQGGRTTGGVPEFVIPNGPIPAGATTRVGP